MLFSWLEHSSLQTWVGTRRSNLFKCCGYAGVFSCVLGTNQPPSHDGHGAEMLMPVIGVDCDLQLLPSICSCIGMDLGAVRI